VDTLLEETRCADPGLATRLERPLSLMVDCLLSTQ
jgi:hypothetical protein